MALVEMHWIEKFLEDLSSEQKEFKTETFEIKGIMIEGTETPVTFNARNTKIFI